MSIMVESNVLSVSLILCNYMTRYNCQLIIYIYYVVFNSYTNLIYRKKKHS